MIILYISSHCVLSYIVSLHLCGMYLPKYVVSSNEVSMEVNRDLLLRFNVLLPPVAFVFFTTLNV